MWIMQNVKMRYLYTSYCTYAAPSEPPQNVVGSFINSTSLLVNWTTPTETSHNGIIRNYIIRYSRSEMVDSDVLTVNSIGLSVVIVDLDEYTLYNVSVSAVTVADGPPASIQVRTDSDGELRDWHLSESRWFEMG